MLTCNVLTCAALLYPMHRSIRAALASQGGPIVAVLSVSFWTPIARLTFGVYLTHIMVIRLLYNSTAKEFDYNDVSAQSTEQLLR
jgi:peptidoglycan/LPS O-acetylase OafA/YrhL